MLSLGRAADNLSCSSAKLLLAVAAEDCADDAGNRAGTELISVLASVATNSDTTVLLALNCNGGLSQCNLVPVSMVEF